MLSNNLRAELVACSATTLDGRQVRELRDAVRAAKSRTASQIIVDLQNVQEATPDGVFALLDWATQDAPREGGIVFAGARGNLLLTICQIRLQRDVDCYSSAEAARGALGG